MKVEEAKERLQDYLLHGIASEIFRAEEAYSLAAEIGNHAEEINSANFGEFFGSLQIILSDRQTLSIVKLFDSGKRHPTRSIPATLSILKSYAELWKLSDRQALCRFLIDAGGESSEVESLDDAGLTRALVAHFENTLPASRLPASRYIGLDKRTASLGALQQARNKVIAHNEDIKADELPTVTWGEARSLLNYAKKFVATVGDQYLGLIFSDSSDNYSPTNDARRTSQQLRRLLKSANILEGRRC